MKPSPLSRFSFLSFFLSFLSLLVPSLVISQTVTGSGDANAISKWIGTGGGGGHEEGDVTEITTTSLYYLGSNFGIHTASPGAPLHVLGRSIFEGDPNYEYNRLYLSHALGFSLNTSNTVGYVGFNLFRGANSYWYRFGDQTHNGGSLILGNTKGDLFFGVVSSTGGSSPTPLSDPEMLSRFKMTLTNEGKLGVGLLAPRTNLEIVHNGGEKCGFIMNQASGSMSTNEIQFHRNDIEKWAIGSHINDSRPNSFFIWNHTRGNTDFFIAENGWIGINTLWPTAWFDVEGSFEAQRIGIGTTPPASGSTFKLYVEGGIMAREVKVTASSFPDYVFEKDYPRLSISELADYIDINHKLPGIPSAKDIAENEGMELGSMQIKLLEKIEEQALYIIDLQKQIDELKSLIEANGEGRK